MGIEGYKVCIDLSRLPWLIPRFLFVRRACYSAMSLGALGTFRQGSCPIFRHSFLSLMMKNVLAPWWSSGVLLPLVLEFSCPWYNGIQFGGLLSQVVSVILYSGYVITLMTDTPAKT